MTHGTVTSAVSIRALEKENPGSITIEHFSPAQRAANAARTAGKTFAATVACVFIPVAHFILVPTGLLLTAVLAFLSYRKRSRIKAFKGECPACGAVIELSASSADRLPLYEFCDKCSREITIIVQVDKLS